MNTENADYGSPGPTAEVVHRCPPKGSGLMPCCGKTPFEVPRYHRLTVNPSLDV